MIILMVDPYPIFKESIPFRFLFKFEPHYRSELLSPVTLYILRVKHIT